MVKLNRTCLPGKTFMLVLPKTEMSRWRCYFWSPEVMVTNSFRKQLDPGTNTVRVEVQNKQLWATSWEPGITLDFHHSMPSLQGSRPLWGNARGMISQAWKKQALKKGSGQKTRSCCCEVMWWEFVQPVIRKATACHETPGVALQCSTSCRTDPQQLEQRSWPPIVSVPPQWKARLERAQPSLKYTFIAKPNMNQFKILPSGKACRNSDSDMLLKYPKMYPGVHLLPQDQGTAMGGAYVLLLDALQDFGYTALHWTMKNTRNHAPEFKAETLQQPCWCIFKCCILPYCW